MRGDRVLCDLCPRGCRLREGQTGFCRARRNVGGAILPSGAGRAAALALDPIEKKPLRRFFPGSFILSYGSFGCSLRCPWCQNAGISMAGEGECLVRDISPGMLADLALRLSGKSPGNIGVAFTYNEPLIAWEFVRDTSILLHERGLKSVVVTNGWITRKYADQVLPHIDALNIDLKGFTEDFYRTVKGDLETVKAFIRAAAGYGCHVEVTTLVVPGRNDGEKEMEEEARWLASVDPAMPLHLTRFFPQYRVTDVPPTPVGTLFRLREVAQRFLKDVFVGNV